MRFLLGLGLLALFLVLQYQLWIGDGSLGQMAQLQREIEVQKVKNQQLKTRNEIIAREIEILSSSDDAMEEVARSKLGMIGENETFYLIP
ncbi:MAG: septum formation initiator family protein, partial [Pseudomonadales bacterium]